MSPFFRDELLAPSPPFFILSLWTEEKGGSSGRGLYDERGKEVNLFQIYNTDSDNAMELDSYVDPNGMNHPFHRGKSLPAGQERG